MNGRKYPPVINQALSLDESQGLDHECDAYSFVKHINQIRRPVEVLSLSTGRLDESDNPRIHSFFVSQNIY